MKSQTSLQGVGRRQFANCGARHAVLLGIVSAEQRQQIRGLEFPSMLSFSCYRVGELYLFLLKRFG
jgi:hypothetical protein